jgi:putative transposase
MKIYLQEESYTSKCDALAGEAICYHDEYMGKRHGRLFISSRGRTLNADLNGAMNIMRKHFIDNYKMDLIMHRDKLNNPKRIRISVKN